MTKKERTIEALAIYCKTGNAKECSKIEATPLPVIYGVSSDRIVGGRPALRLVTPINKKEALKTKKLWDEIEASSEGDPLFEQTRRAVIDAETSEEVALFELAREKRRWEAHAQDESNPPGSAFEHALPRPLDDEPIVGKAIVLIYMKPAAEDDRGKKKFSMPSKGGGAKILEKLKKAAKIESDAANDVDETNPLKRLCELEAEFAEQSEDRKRDQEAQNEEEVVAKRSKTSKKAPVRPKKKSRRPS